ncbi:MAG: prepilin-type N-terminal cleavage/methylation domain-containing protein [Planctomycetes bacterium]|nr:prepilin-type N-terminal cleavage/methylation domain-containing protein [Planctomycetota bacterium]
MNNKPNTGFSLLEIVIVVAILVAVIGGAIYVLSSGQQAFDEGAMTSFLESQAGRVIDVMRDDIGECLVITAGAPATANNYASLTIQVPIRSGGNYLNPTTGAVYWGAYDSNNNPQSNWHITYRFEPDPAKSGLNALNENTDRKDYNQDGDISDSFDIGRMIKEVYDSSAVLRHSTELCNDIITVAGTRYEDINNDGNADRIFTLCDKNGQPVTGGGTGVRINIWLGGKLGAKQNPIIVNANTVILLVNPQ